MNNVEEDLHSVYLTMLELTGTKMVRHTNFCTVLLDADKDLRFVNVFQYHFSVGFKNQTAFLGRTVFKMKEFNLKSKRSEPYSFTLYEFSGELESMLKGLAWIEQQVRGG